MSDLIERLRDFDPIEGQLRGMPIQQEAADRIEQLEADCEMKDKRIDWTVADNVKKAIRIERLEATLQHFYDYGYDRGRCEEALDSKEPT